MPILNQILFKGVKIGEFNNPKIKKRTEITWSVIADNWIKKFLK